MVGTITAASDSARNCLTRKGLRALFAPERLVVDGVDLDDQAHGDVLVHDLLVTWQRRRLFQHLSWGYQRRLNSHRWR